MYSYFCIRKNGGTAIITADHGNAEVNVEHDIPHTAHTLNKVPCIITKENISIIEGGDLTWLAPTSLSLLGIQIPESMTGKMLY